MIHVLSHKYNIFAKIEHRISLLSYDFHCSFIERKLQFTNQKASFLESEKLLSPTPLTVLNDGCPDLNPPS